VFIAITTPHERHALNNTQPFMLAQSVVASPIIQLSQPIIVELMERFPYRSDAAIAFFDALCEAGHE